MSPTSTSSSSGGPWRFARRAFLFAAPLLIAIGVLELCLYRTGDLWSIEAIVARQVREGNLLFGSGYHPDNRAYQSAMMVEKRAEILVLGSSRVLQIRDFMFHPLEDSFYNAGRAIGDLAGLEQVVARMEEMPELRPEVLVLGMEPTWLTARQSGNAAVAPRGFRWWRPGDHAELIRRFCFGPRGGLSFGAIRNGAGGPSPHYGYPAIGNLALEEGSGYRWDGSRQYDPQILLDAIAEPGYVDREIPPIIERVRRGLPPFDRGDMEAGSLSRIETVVGDLRAMDIELFVILPPFSDEVREEIGASLAWRPLWRRYRGELPRLLAGLGVPCLDLTDHDALGLADAYMFDGIHASEVYMARAILEIMSGLPAGSFLEAVDVTALERRLADRQVIPLSSDPPPKGGL